MTGLFLSYPVEADRTGGISDFADRLQGALRQKTGHRYLRIFRDARDIELGDAWRARLDVALAEATHLLAIVQPLFFASGWCVQELCRFHALMHERGHTDRILVVLWEPTTEVRHPTTDAGRIAAETQFFDWTPYRLLDWGEPKRVALDRLATEVTKALVRAGMGGTAAVEEPGRATHHHRPAEAPVEELPQPLIDAIALLVRHASAWRPPGFDPQLHDTLASSPDAVLRAVRERLIDLDHLVATEDFKVMPVVHQRQRLYHLRCLYGAVARWFEVTDRVLPAPLRTEV